VGFPGARLAARLETRVKRNGKWSCKWFYLVSSFHFRGNSKLRACSRSSEGIEWWKAACTIAWILPCEKTRAGAPPPEPREVLGTIRRVVGQLGPTPPLMPPGRKTPRQAQY